jgi:hypothetical protein
MPHDPRPHAEVPAAPTYRIRLHGHLGPRLIDRFGGFSVRHEPDGTTTLTGQVADQAALHGLLRRIRDLSLPLLGVTRVAADPDEPGTA